MFNSINVIVPYNTDYVILRIVDDTLSHMRTLFLVAKDCEGITFTNPLYGLL